MTERNYEIERNPEILAPSIEVGQAGLGHYEQEHTVSESIIQYGNDALVYNSDIGVFGVFDGVGVREYAEDPYPSDASGAASQAIESYDWQNNLPIHEQVQAAMAEAREVVNSLSGIVVEGPATTALFGKIDQTDSTTKLHWGNAGDCLLILERDGEQLPISTEQDYQNRIDNWLGGLGRIERRMEDEFGTLELQAGDKLIMCSDGITGDREPDLLPGYLIEKALQEGDPTSAAQKLVEFNTKTDDKSVVVIFCN